MYLALLYMIGRVLSKRFLGRGYTVSKASTGRLCVRLCPSLDTKVSAIGCQFDCQQGEKNTLVFLLVVSPLRFLGRWSPFRSSVLCRSTDHSNLGRTSGGAGGSWRKVRIC